MLNASVTLFCQELDKLIESYEKEEPLHLEMADQLAALQYLLDEHVDTGMLPSVAFNEIQKRLTHDLEEFLYHVIYDEIEIGEISYAKELLEGFDRYFQERKWFDYLWARIEAEEDPEEGFERIDELLHRFQDEKPVDYFLEILTFLALRGTHEQFVKHAERVLQSLSIERDFREFLHAVSSHYHYLSLHTLACATEKLLHSRFSRAETQLIDYQDVGITEVQQILRQKLIL